MVKTTKLTPEQKKAKKAEYNKNYMQKVMSYYRDYENLEECYQFVCKCFKRSIVVNCVLLITTILWWIF